MERTIYLLLTRSETYFSRLIHLATDARYTHVSIGLDGPAGPFYSFARKYPKWALPAGLVEEQAGRGFFSLHPGIPCCLYAMQVPERVYRELKQKVSQMYAQRERYRYNLLGALACFFHFTWTRRHHYFCSEFVADLLESTGAAELSQAPSLTRPIDFCKLTQLRLIYQGNVASLLFLQGASYQQAVSAPVAFC